MPYRYFVDSLGGKTMKITTERLNRIIYASYYILTLLGVLLVMVGTSKYGPGVTHDSVAYIYSARSVLDGRGYEYFGYPSPFIQWGPLFSTVLVAVEGLGLDVYQAARVINAVIFGLIVLFTCLWLGERVKHKVFAVLGGMTVVVSWPLVWASRFIWSEPFFILFLLLFLWTFQEYLWKDSVKWLAWAGVFASLASLTRYIGVTIVLMGGLFLLFQKKKFASKVYNIFVFGAIASLPTLIWVVRNYILSSTLVGMRTPSLVSFGHNVKLVLKAVTQWMFPFGYQHGSLSTALLLLLKVASAGAFVLLVVGVVAALWRGISLKRNQKESGMLAWMKWNSSSLLLPAAFAIIYTVYLMVSATRIHFEAIGDRYMLPILIPMIMFAFLMIDGAVQALCDKLNIKTVIAGFSVLLCAFLVYPTVRTALSTKYCLDYGAGGYMTTAWKDNSLIKELQENPPGAAIFSNMPDALYTLVGLDAKYTPKKSGLDMYGLEQFRKAITENGASCLVWFDKVINSSIYNADELKALFDMREVKRVEDGAIYLVTAQQ